MNFKPIDLSVFPAEREQKLRSIYRYAGFEVMYYRPHLWMHTHRVLWLLEELMPLIISLFPGFDVEKARILALVHDDAEMITGDITANIKSRMTETELAAYEAREIAANAELVARYPKIVHGYVYAELLQHAAKKDCLEAQVVSYVDRLDALCESLHETLAGNVLLTWALIFNVRHTALYGKKIPQIEALVGNKQSPLTSINGFASNDEIPKSLYTHLGVPHIPEFVRKETDFPFYDIWRRVTIEKGGEEGVRWLTEQREK